MHEQRFEATEKIMELQFAHLERRLEQIEALIERLEKRLWLSVYGVVAVVVTQAVQGILDYAPN
ncbi:hypothetical protein [Rhodobacter sp. TJ_12]|uniref:GTA head formation protein, RCAP_rcc01685 family n=1 Tax=Rhodobacter sp. TJ_12 TaxID=2029399 RepID=UPI001CBE1729|nr:hypothetical protein [Rhodobacter sp. TJ_12]